MSNDLTEVEDFEKEQDFFSAVRKLQQLSADSPTDSRIAFKLASNLLSLGRVDESLPLFESCTSADDVPPHWRLNFGHALKASGSYTKAANQYQALSRYRKHQISASAYWSLANLKKYQFSDEDKKDIERRLEEPEIPQGYEGLYHLTLATALDQACDYDKAFRQMQLGNNKIGEIRPFRGDLFQKLIKELMSDFQLPAERPMLHGRRPIFVVGLPRSGSTLVEQILSAHPDVNSTDELKFLSDIARGLESKNNYATTMSRLTDRESYNLGAAYLQKIEGYTKNSEPCFVDKTPENFLHIGLIKTIFPNAKVVDIVRDPLDNAMSLYKQFFAKGREYTYSLNGIVFYWQGYLTLMKYWRSMYPDTILRLDYKRLVTKPREAIEDLLTHCELSHETVCFSPHKSPRPVLTPSAAQVREPISSTSLGSGLSYKKHVKTYLPKFAELRRVSESLN